MIFNDRKHPLQAMVPANLPVVIATIFLMTRITVLPMVGAGHGETILRFAAHSQQSWWCSTNASIDLQDDNVIYDIGRGVMTHTQQEWPPFPKPALKAIHGGLDCGRAPRMTTYAPNFEMADDEW
ncbi:hypothetical protein MUK42_11187 [Musa troglodytarum]|uniref:Uncharacterized protein n=1 Tax=Musa troglodytarum TaxID=320322 RepID=A0A9E7HJS9_9LILI|nr:hypothetical protein MUK42_11187 [Musa troglodytarum]